MEPSGQWVRETFTHRREGNLSYINLASPVARWKEPMVCDRPVTGWRKTHGTPPDVLEVIAGVFQLWNK